MKNSEHTKFGQCLLPFRSDCTVFMSLVRICNA